MIVNNTFAILWQKTSLLTISSSLGVRQYIVCPIGIDLMIKHLESDIWLNISGLLDYSVFNVCCKVIIKRYKLGIEMVLCNLYKLRCYYIWANLVFKVDQL